MLNLQNTAAVNFAGSPALAVPILMNGKTVSVTSLQLIGPRLSEAKLLDAGRLIETNVLGQQVRGHEIRAQASENVLRRNASHSLSTSFN